MDYTLKDNSKEILALFEKAKIRGLEAIGLEAEGNAKDILTDEVYSEDKEWRLTGRLRNSVTFALSGEKANADSYEYKEDGKKKKAHYKGRAPKDKDKSLYIGTNVVYAPGIELGTHRAAGAVHFLQRAAEDFKDDYKKLMEESMRNA